MPKSERPNIQIGTKLWYQFSNRVYTVIGETSRSWELSYEGQPWTQNTKIPKCSLKEGWTLDEQEYLDWKYQRSYQWEIGDLVRRKATGAQLRQIALMLGFDPEKKDA